jgi:hypothetical protein
MEMKIVVGRGMVVVVGGQGKGEERCRWILIWWLCCLGRWGGGCWGRRGVVMMVMGVVMVMGGMGW